MKLRKIIALVMAVLMVTAFVGCSKGKDSSSSELAETESTVSKEPENKFAVDPLTGIQNLDPNQKGQRPVGIMINNIKISLPQRGISKADICYEVLAEGGITRILAIFPNLKSIPDTGSVRSARHYYLSLATGHKAIFVHFGGSAYALNLIKERGYKTINFLNSYGSYRDKNRVGKIPYEHTAFTDGTRLTESVRRKGIKTTANVPTAFNFGDNTSVMQSGSAANNITVPFSSYTVSKFTYNPELKLYEKSQFNQKHIDATTGKALAVTNVFVLKTGIKLMNTNSKSNYIDVDLSEGEGYYACDGKIIPIKWKKGNFENQMRYYTQDGKPLTVKPGKSWVSIVSEKRTVSYN